MKAKFVDCYSCISFMSLVQYNFYYDKLITIASPHFYKSSLFQHQVDGTNQSWSKHYLHNNTTKINMFWYKIYKTHHNYINSAYMATGLYKINDGHSLSLLAWRCYFHV